MTMGLFDPTTGEVLTSQESQGGCERCATVLQERLQAERDLQAVERDLRAERREVARLKTELNKRERGHASMPAAEALFRYWVKALGKNPKTTVFGEKRRKAVLARLNEQEPEYIARAIDGLAVGHFISSDGKRYDDLELVCRDEVKLEQFHTLAEFRNAPTMIGPAWVAEWGSRHD